jgi:hypothetical protein
MQMPSGEAVLVSVQRKDTCQSKAADVESPSVSCALSVARAVRLVATVGRTSAFFGLLGVIASCGGGGSDADQTNDGLALKSGTTLTSAGKVPTPLSIAGKPVVSQIIAISGQIIENVHVTTQSGSCIIISNVTNVVVRNSEIGPCGQSGDTDTQGIRIENASSVAIESNVIHDVSSGVYALNSNHPIVMDRNYVYNVRGPFPRGQMIQMNNVAGGAKGSRITCNVSDAMPGTRYGVLHGNTNDGVEDHINMYQSPGLTWSATEIAYNRLRGGHNRSNSGSGLVLGDGGGGYVNAHHNTIVNVVNIGAGIAGGSNINIDSNRIFQQNGQARYVNLGLMVWGQDGAECNGGHTVRGNRVWTVNSNGEQNSFWDAGNCGRVEVSGNVFGDKSLSPDIFDEVPRECE